MQKDHFSLTFETVPMNVTQAEASVTYLYGMSNSTAQEKGIYGHAGPYTGMTNQTVKNLAFAISSSARPEYMPSYSIPSNCGLPLFSPLCSCVIQRASFGRA